MLPKFIANQFKKPTGLLGILSSRVMVRKNKQIYLRLTGDLDLQPGDKLLEIGYGPGIGIRMVIEKCPGCTVSGIDFSQLMYKRAGRYNKVYIEAGRVELQFGDFLETPSLYSDYDKIFCVNVVYFWSDLSKAFEKILSMLRERGSFHIYMMDKSMLQEKHAPDSVFNKYSIEQVLEALKTAGFFTIQHYERKGFYIKATK